jgi:hypothetical protein
LPGQTPPWQGRLPRRTIDAARTLRSAGGHQ